MRMGERHKAKLRVCARSIDRSIYRRVDRLQVRFMISFVGHACMHVGRDHSYHLRRCHAMPYDDTIDRDGFFYPSFSLAMHVPGGGRAEHTPSSSENREPDVHA
jgi:hypothetical protein